MGKASRRRTASRAPGVSAGSEGLRAASRRRSSPVRSRACPVRPTGWRCARSSRPPPPPPVRPARARRPATPRRTATVATVLPLAWSGLHRVDGEVLIGLQSGTTTGDASRDLAQVLLLTAAAEPGTPVPSTARWPPPAPRACRTSSTPGGAVRGDRARGLRLLGHRRQELDAEGKDVARAGQRLGHPDDQAGRAADSAYWCRIGERTHLRWVLPDDEDAATDALARLHARGASSDLATTPGCWAPSARAACSSRSGSWTRRWRPRPTRTRSPSWPPGIADALAVDGPLTPEERRARAGLLSRQITLR